MLHTTAAGKRVPSHELSPSCEGAREAQADLTLQTLDNNDKTARSNIAIASSSPELTKGHTIQATINGKPVHMLLDTGSAVTLLRLDIWSQCKDDSNKLKQWTGPKLVGVDGTPLQVVL